MEIQVTISFNLKNDFMKFIFSIIALGLIGSCTTTKYSHFSLRDSTWKNTGELETNGYYYCNLNDIEGRISAPKNLSQYEVLILFSNGTFCELSTLFHTQEQIKNYLKLHSNDLGEKDKYAYWGKYKIEHDNIFIEYFFYNPDQHYLGIYRRYGTLCGTNCFIIKKRFMVKDDPIRTDNSHYEYQYMPLEEKIDSINWFY